MPWKRDDLLPASGFLGWVAEVDDAGLVGYVCVGAVGDQAEILILGVNPDHRKQGIAFSLLSEVRDVLKARGIRNLFLEVRQLNEAAAALYRKAGFTETGLRKGYYADTGENARLLRLELS